MLSALKQIFSSYEKFDVNAVARHISDAVLNTPVTHDPWPYLYIENVFPADFYQRILQEFKNSDKHFKDQVHTGDRKVFFGSYEERQEFRVARTGHNATPDTPEFWLQLWDAFISPDFFEALRTRLSPEYHAYFGEFADSPRLKAFLDPTLLITRHRANYYLGPHTDRREKMVTCIFNVPEDDKSEAIGTAIYSAKDPEFQSDGLTHHDPKLFNHARTLPFRMNSAFIFFRTNVSFHGVEPLTEMSLANSRRSNIQFNWWDHGRRPQP